MGEYGMYYDIYPKKKERIGEKRALVLNNII